MMSRNDGLDGEKILVVIDAGLEELIPGFLENRQSDPREVLVSADDDTIKILGRGMKGTGGGYGFDEITSIRRVLEDAGDNEDAEVI